MSKYLFVVAHPDDEVLGAGAFIYDAVMNRGGEAAVLLFNTCDTTRYEDDYTKIVADLEKSHAFLGISKRSHRKQGCGHRQRHSGRSDLLQM